MDVFDDMSGFVALSLFPKAARPKLAARSSSFKRAYAMRCSAWEYRLLAEGSAQFSVNGLLKPWDHAAGQLIHTEAGGFSRLSDDTPYRPGLREGRLILAPDEDDWTRLRDQLRGSGAELLAEL
jgi:fructose-1,6-bisphosphatase/inositol monophosphatase family enzyme